MKFTGTLREPEKLSASFPALKLPLDGGYKEGYSVGHRKGYESGYASAVERARHKQEHHIYCICGASKGNITPLDRLKHKPGCTWQTDGELVWTPWNETTRMPTSSGNYYLTKDVILDCDSTQHGGTAFKSAVDINIDLNGHDYVCNGGSEHSRLFRIRDDDGLYADGEFKVTIGLTDSVGGGVVKLKPTDKVRNGAIVWLTESTNTFNLYNGILDASGITSVNGAPAVCLNGGTFNMYGGQIVGGIDDNSEYLSLGGSGGQGGTADNLEGSSLGNQGGGAIGVQAGAVFNLYDGTVSGGRSAFGGGNFSVKGILNIKGGTISDGIATGGNGGNIYLIGNGAQVNISGGEITGGNARNVAGNIIVFGGAQLNVSGGKIYGGTCERNKDDGKLYNYNHSNVQVNNGTMNLSGGEVSSATFDENGYLNLSGSGTINTYTDPETNVTSLGLRVGAKLATIDDSKGAFTGSIAVSTTGKITTATKEEYLSCFISLISGMRPVYKADSCIWIE